MSCHELLLNLLLPHRRNSLRWQLSFSFPVICLFKKEAGGGFQSYKLHYTSFSAVQA